MRKVLSTFLIASAGGAVALGLFKLNNKSENVNFQQKQSAMPIAYSGAMPEANTSFVLAAEKSVNSVVHITTRQMVQGAAYDPWQSFFFGNPNLGRPQVQTSSGSGVIISADGYIATNNHVVDNAEEVEVVLNNKKSYTAKVIGKDPSTDLALLKIDESALPYMSYGNSDDVHVGEWVLAVGNPFNLTSTVTAGIVSAKGRNINIIGSGDPNQNLFPIESFIQTDAAVNPGNSGGALVDPQGNLIGINTAIASQTGSFTGYSFAIPVNIVKKVMGDLLEYGEVQRAFIGVSIREIDNKLAEEKGFKDLKGVYVTGLTDGGSAEQGGVEEGDIITKVGTVDVNSPSELQEQVGRHRPGDKLGITVIREGKEKLLSLTLRNKNGNMNVVKTEKAEAINKLGASFEEISQEEKQDLRIENGVRVAGLMAGKLRGAGVKEGFIITSIDKKPVKSVEEINAVLLNKKGGVLIEGVYPNGLRAYYGFGL